LFSRNYILTYLTEFAIVLSGILVYKYAAVLFGTDGFNEYSVCRRTVSFIQPLLVLGLGVGLPRYVAFAMAGSGNKNVQGYFYGSLLVVGAVGLFVFPVIYFFRAQFAYLFFGDEVYHYLIPPLIVMMMGLTLHSLVYSFFRGEINMNTANVMQFLNLGLVPVLAFYFSGSVMVLFFTTGLVTLGTSVLFLISVMMRYRFSGMGLGDCVRELVRYGVQRVPGDVALGAFLALPAYLTAHFVDDNLKTAGNVAFGMALLNMAGAAFGPICLLLLPKASQVIAQKDFGQINSQVDRITAWTICITLLGLAAVELFAEWLLGIYLGSVYSGLAWCVRIIMPACLGYTVYISLRSILDAYYVKAVNTKNIFISFFVFIAGVGLLYKTGFNYEYMIFIFVGAFTLLGLLTYAETKKLIRINLGE
jgi:O-antigen/teichoic acid export membrane protein